MVQNLPTRKELSCLQYQCAYFRNATSKRYYSKTKEPINEILNLYRSITYLKVYKGNQTNCNHSWRFLILLETGSTHRFYKIRERAGLWFNSRALSSMQKHWVQSLALHKRQEDHCWQHKESWEGGSVGKALVQEQKSSDLQNSNPDTAACICNPRVPWLDGRWRQKNPWNREGQILSVVCTQMNTERPCLKVGSKDIPETVLWSHQGHVCT